VVEVVEVDEPESATEVELDGGVVVVVESFVAAYVATPGTTETTTAVIAKRT
jgi:hypothetical protein